jgi:hypothetical protein
MLSFQANIFHLLTTEGGFCSILLGESRNLATSNVNGLGRRSHSLDGSARDRPEVEMPKVRIGSRLAADVVEGTEATGRGSDARLEKVWRGAPARGSL